MSLTSDKIDAQLTVVDANAKGGADSSAPPSRGRGRPPGSKNKLKDGSVLSSNVELSKPKSKFVYKADSDSIKAMGLLAQAVWNFAAPILKVRDINDKEAEELGQLLDPVLEKWIPILGDFKYETALVMGIFVLYTKTKAEYVPSQERESSPL